MNYEARSINLRSQPETPVAPRTIDLYGRATDGRVMLWKRAVSVVAANTFECDCRWIRSGHYVIDHNGDAIVVHCGNMEDGSVSVQFMHGELTPYSLPRRMIESMLLGKLVISEEQQAAVFEGRRLSDFFATAPDGTGTSGPVNPTCEPDAR